ncbi:MAG: response regulator [Halanaerobiaceae bacterium]|nr:response regulator [Halanaerobiaceae bacterium]
MPGRILIVDDSAFMRRTLRKILEKAGFEVIGEAADGGTAIEKYKELKPDVVTMDITMPGINGIETVKNILAINDKARIIMCSAIGQQGIIIEALQAGAKEYLIKPFRESLVIETINKVMRTY